MAEAYEFEIQQLTEQGWECVNTEANRIDAIRSRDEYRANQPEYPVRYKRVPL